LNWNELKPHFVEAADHLEDVFNQTIKICDLYEQLNQEVAAACGRDDHLFSKTQECLETLNLVTSISDPSLVPPEAMARAAQIFMRAQYMLSIISRVVTMMENCTTQCTPITHLHSKGYYH
jgi:hypothetical protein